jgi:hypothetical protein
MPPLMRKKFLEVTGLAIGLMKKSFRVRMAAFLK